jgi:hypothetical protein
MLASNIECAGYCARLRALQEHGGLAVCAVDGLANDTSGKNPPLPLPPPLLLPMRRLVLVCHVQVLNYRVRSPSGCTLPRAERLAAEGPVASWITANKITNGGKILLRDTSLLVHVPRCNTIATV